jgi:hypothetical protein
MAGRVDNHDQNGLAWVGNPSLKLAATTMDARWLNDKQEEIVKYVEAAGIAPSLSNNEQVKAATQIFIQRRQGYLVLPGSAFHGHPDGNISHTSFYITPSLANQIFQYGRCGFQLPIGTTIKSFTIWGYTASDPNYDVIVNMVAVYIPTGASVLMASLEIVAGATTATTSTITLPRIERNWAYNFVVMLKAKNGQPITNARFYGLRLALAEV